MSRYSLPRPIRTDDDVANFACGDDVLDQWLRRYAVANHYGGGSKTYVTLHDGRIVGYYALAAASIQGADATARVAQGMPQPIPAILLGRMAVDLKEQGKGLGAHLLRDAIQRTIQTAEVIGVRVLLVHAASDADRSFYLHFNFEQSPTDDMHLMLLLKDAQAPAGR